jgi:putative tryptophan/tyrosine transport system substrate-binding protein
LSTSLFSRPRISDAATRVHRLIGATATSTLAASAQQPASSVIGYMDVGAPDLEREAAANLRRAMAEAGFAEGRNFTVEYRWAEHHLERLPALANDLVRRRVALIIAINTPPALAAKAATNSIPIVFSLGSDPVEIGLVGSLGHPGGNVTGVHTFNAVLAAKRLELLRACVPDAGLIAYFVNPINKEFAESEARELRAAAGKLRVDVLTLDVSKQDEFADAFAALVRERAGGLVMGGDGLFSDHFDQLVKLAEHHRVPTIFRSREATALGGLLSYGTDYPSMRRLVGIYAARILKGERPADLPVQQVTKVELAINTKTAKALGVTVPETLLATADEVIE